MANPLRGEFDFAAAGTKLKLRLDIDAICNIEAALDLGFGEIVDRVLRRRAANYRIARALLVAASGGRISAERASELVSEHAIEVWPQMVALVAAALPPAPPEEDKDENENPPDANPPDGTGQSS